MLWWSKWPPEMQYRHNFFRIFRSIYRWLRCKKRRPLQSPEPITSDPMESAPWSKAKERKQQEKCLKLTTRRQGTKYYLMKKMRTILVLLKADKQCSKRQLLHRKFVSFDLKWAFISLALTKTPQLQSDKVSWNSPVLRSSGGIALEPIRTKNGFALNVS